VSGRGSFAAGPWGLGAQFPAPLKGAEAQPRFSGTVPFTGVTISARA
jgi:hypothetical protein